VSTKGNRPFLYQTNIRPSDGLRTLWPILALTCEEKRPIRQCRELHLRRGEHPQQAVHELQAAEAPAVIKKILLHPHLREVPKRSPFPKTPPRDFVYDPDFFGGLTR